MGLFLQGITPEQLSDALGLQLPDARRIVAQVHRDEHPSTPSSTIRRTAREAVLASGATIPTLEIVTERASQVDPFVKIALRTADGHVIETVRIPLEVAGRFSICVSSQVGCALGCTFCATGRMGLLRNLETWEIVEQVRVVRRRSGNQRAHGIVFQGMGEPMANLDRVLAAIRVLTEPSAQAIDARNITVCTSGLPTGIRRLAQEVPRVRLGLSLGSARVSVRRSLMPIERAHGLTTDVLDAAAFHAEYTGLAPMWAITLLRGVNDTPEDAAALADLVLGFAARTGHRPRLSVIPYNAIGDDAFERTDDERETTFRDALRLRGVFTHKRYSGGGDVAAACGQLAAHA